KIISGANRITLLAHLEPPNDNVADWQLGFSGGTIVLAGIDSEPPLIFNRIASALRFDTDKKRVLLTQADISNGEIGIAVAVNIVASGVTVRPVDRLPAVHDADLKAHVTGRTASVTIGQAVADTPAGRKLNFSDFVFEVPDTHAKPAPSRVRMKIDGPVPAAAEILSSDRLSDLSGA